MIHNKHTQQLCPTSLYTSNALLCWFQTYRYYAMNFNYFDMEPHSHSELEIMYIASGSCTVYYWTKDNIKKELFLKEADYVFIDCHAIHQLEVTKGIHCRILNLEIAILPTKNTMSLSQLTERSKSVTNLLRFPGLVFKGFDSEGNLHTIISELHRHLQGTFDEAENQLMQELIMTQFLIELGRQRTNNHALESGNKYVLNAIKYLSNHFDEDIKIQDIALEVGVSSAYLQRIFKKQTGQSLVDKLNEFRIEKAKILLDTSRLTVTDIAISVGFNNRQHFTHTFRKYTGCSPAIYCKHKGNYEILL